jgi:hypothetical protein
MGWSYTRLRETEKAARKQVSKVLERIFGNQTKHIFRARMKPRVENKGVSRLQIRSV